MVRFLKYHVNTLRDASAIKWKCGSEEYTLGYSELRIIAADGKVYAAPDTILYSIREIGYRPSEAFLDALSNGISPESDEYRAYLEKYDRREFWGASEEQKAKIEKMESVIRNKDISAFEELIRNDESYLDIVTNYGSVLNCALKNNAEEIALMSIDKGISLTNFSGTELLTALEKKISL